MSEKLKELLEKINQEGVKQAEKKARAIESEARNQAQTIVNEAKSEAQRIIKEAKGAARKTKQASEIALKQAGRDLTLSLKDDIRNIFDRIIAAETSKAISHEEIIAILKDLIGKFADKKGEISDVRVLLRKEDLQKVREGFLSKLKHALKDGMEFRPASNINAGFSISFDKGKSFFDFTDEGLVGALCAYLNPELAGLLKK